jgi:predicted nuclease of restriction endonuclease-like (RecB) superfamily
MPKSKLKPKAVAKKSALTRTGSDTLLSDLRELITTAREKTATAVNAALVLLNWSIGDRIRRDILKEKRAEYGREILGALSQQLTAEFGKGYTYDNLTRMVKLAEVFPNVDIVAALSRQLGWTHFVLLLPLKKQLQRDFYAEMCRVERWSVRTLRDKINGMLYERTAISRKPEQLAAEELGKLRQSDQLTPDLVFRDPYFLDFLGLKDTYSEHDLESAILREIESVILELGDGFCFVARQKRIVIDGEDFRIDLLFFHRVLRRLVAIDLKLGKFQAADKGQMELYLRWLEKHEKRPGEEPPVGLILCEDRGEEQVELLQLDQSGIRVASYFTELPSKEVLQRKLKQAATLARQRLEARPME